MFWNNRSHVKSLQSTSCKNIDIIWNNMGHAKVHEKYAYTDGQRGYYDIAVLTLDSDIKYEPLTVQPICLPYKANNQQNFWYNKTGVITGYAHQDQSATYLGTVYILLGQ